MNSLHKFLAGSVLTLTVLTGLAAQAAVTTYDNRSTWQQMAGNAQTIDFSVNDSGAPITSPPGYVEFPLLAIKGVKFLNVLSYYNESIHAYPHAKMRVELPTGTTAIAMDLSPFTDAPGTYSIQLSTGETFQIPAGTIPLSFDFFGLTSTIPVQWIEISLESSFLVMDNFSFVADNPVQTVALDIVPGSRINPVRPQKGRVEVAILSTDEYDASSTDVRTVRFGKNGTEARIDKAEYRDVNGDMVNDLVMEFRMRDTGIVCHDTTAKLSGKTVQGQQIAGSDSIKTVGCK